MALTRLLLLHAAAFALLALTLACTGFLIVARLRTSSRIEILAVATATGLGAVGTLLFGLGMVGGLYRSTVLAMVALALAAAILLRRNGHPESRVERAALSRGPTSRSAALFIAAALIPTLVWSLYPPTAYDTTVYHLPFARAFAAAHRLVAVPDLVFPVFPQLAEALFAGMMLATGVDTTTHLVQFLSVAATALLLYAAGRRFFSPRAGLWAAALWLAHPLVHYQGASANVDATLALFCLLAVHAWEVWREEGAKGWLALSGAAAGLAAATKYLGLLWLGLLVLLTLVAAPRRRRLSSASALLAIALCVAGPWYLRIYLYTGNPLHPLLAQVFAGGHASAIDHRLGIDAGTSALDLPLAIGRRLGAIASRPWELAEFAWKASFDPGAFDRQSPLAPWHLVLAPLAVCWAWRDRRLLRWLLLVSAYAVFWTTSQPRFQLPNAALLALVGAGGLEHLARNVGPLRRRLQSKPAVWALAAVLLAPGPLYAIFKVARLRVAPPATPAARADFLDREVAGHSGVRFLNEKYGSAFTLFTLRVPEVTYYAQGRVLGQASGPYRFGRVRPLLGDSEALFRELRAMGVDALLVVGDLRRSLPRDEAFHLRFRLVFQDDRQDLYELAPDPAPPAPGPSSESPAVSIRMRRS